MSCMQLLAVLQVGSSWILNLSPMLVNLVGQTCGLYMQLLEEGRSPITNGLRCSVALQYCLQSTDLSLRAAWQKKAPPQHLSAVWQEKLLGDHNTSVPYFMR